MKCQKWHHNEGEMAHLPSRCVYYFLLVDIMRKARINIRLGEEDKQKLLRFASEKDMSISEFILYNCVDKYDSKSVRNVERVTHRLLLLHQEMTRIGRNVNQIARYLHSESTPRYDIVEKYLRTLAYNTRLIIEKFALHKLL